MAVSVLESSPDAAPRVYRTLYEGCVLALREINGYDDSDFVAVCWDEEQGRVVRYTYATTRCWTYLNGAKVDASDELRVAIGERIVESLAASVSRVVGEVKATVVRGAVVRVVAGRKYVGRAGEVFWVGERKNPYNYRWETRVGFKAENDDSVFVPVEQVQVVESPFVGELLAAEVAARFRQMLRDELFAAGCEGLFGEMWARLSSVVDGVAV